MLHLEVDKNISSLKSDVAGNLGEHISTSRWIITAQIFGELHFFFSRGLERKAGCHGVCFSYLQTAVQPFVHSTIIC